MISYYSEQFKDSDTQVNVCLSYVMIEGSANPPATRKGVQHPPLYSGMTRPFW